MKKKTKIALWTGGGALLLVAILIAMFKIEETDEGRQIVPRWAKPERPKPAPAAMPGAEMLAAPAPAPGKVINLTAPLIGGANPAGMKRQGSGPTGFYKR